MQLVILAAGRGRRMKELTDKMPKPLLSVFGNNLIEHKLEILPKEIDEVIIVVGYLGDKIKEHFGNEFKGKKIHFVEQKELNGTALALEQAKEFLKGRFMVMMGDDIYSKEDVKSAMKFPWAVLVKKMDEAGRGARVMVDKENRITDIIEGSELQKGMYGNAGLYVLNKDFFKYPLVQIPSGEFGLPQTLVKVAKDIDIKIVECTGWHQISSPEDLERIEKMFDKESKNSKGKGQNDN